jgi:serine protease
VMRLVHAVLVGTIAVGVTGWPASVAYSTGQMTQKQAAIQGLTATRKTSEATVDKLIVKLRTNKTQAQATTMSAARAQSLAKSAGTGMKSLRSLAGGAHLMQLDRPMTVSEARVVAARLVQDPDVEYAEPNVRFRKLAVPNEPRYTQWQWNLFAPTTTYTGAISSGGTLASPAVGGANLPAGWDLTTGSTDVKVAVIDTGIVNHNDLNGIANSAIYVPAGRFLPGYDFISADSGTPDVPVNFVANDGNGRDPDPSDPGDWITAAEKVTYKDTCDDGVVGASDSSWHGTHMAGIAAATANNAAGIAGIGWNVRIVPIRALGKCGGDLIDIEAAIRWAAGLPVPGVPANANPAQVISLSLGGGDTCGPTMQTAVNAAIAAGAVVVAATGNAGALSLISPANCNGVIAVTAHTINGENADYANIASTVPKAEMLSAPGGGPPAGLGSSGPTNNEDWDGFYIRSSVLFGPTSPTSSTASGSVGSAYAGFTGTSPATPHVAGVAALIKSFAPEATPAEIQSFLISSTSVRPYPAGSVCATGGVFDGQCGTGLLDAEKALSAVGPLALPASVAGNDQVVAPGATVTLNGSASKAYFNKTITAYEWTQTGGAPTVTLATPAAMTTTFTAPATGALTFRLRVTDSAAKVGEDLMVVRVNSAPTLAAAPAGPTVAIGSVVSLTVTATDVDGDPLTYVATTGSTVPLTALSPDGQFVWNTTGYNAGTYQLTYFATDGIAQSTAQTVTITLTGGSAAVPPASGGGGGGGALPWLQLLLLSALLVAPRIRQRVG